MGRTIPQSRISLMLEEKRWKIYQKYLDKKNKKIFKNMISTVYFYNSACSYALNSPRINSILFSIILYHQNFFKKKIMFQIVYYHHCRHQYQIKR